MPPQKNVAATSRSAASARTVSTSQMCSPRPPGGVGSPVTVSPEQASARSPWTAWKPRRASSSQTVVLPVPDSPSTR